MKQKTFLSLSAPPFFIILILFSLLLSLLLSLILVGCTSNTSITDTEDNLIQNTLSENTHIINSSTEKNTSSIIQNTMYKPLPQTSWQWQLSGDINTKYDVEVYDVDLVETPQSVIDQLHKRDIKVICYFSAGSWEEFRDDATQFPESVVGKQLDNYDDERWLDISRFELFSDIIKQRLDLAVTKNCDAIEPDNVDGYTQYTGFDNTYDDQLTYNKWLAKEAHKRGLSIGLKNDLEQVRDLVDYFDFAVNEQCFQYNECELLLPFIKQNKAVFGVEYKLNPTEFCEKAKSMNFSWLKMEYELDGGRIGCE
jgi:hypothetical protein